MPSDVYPVYAQIARASGLQPDTFATTPEMTLPDRGEWLLLPNPIKPAGRWLSMTEVGTIKDWLTRRDDRRLLVDSVYNFGTRLHPTTLELIGTGKAFLMHSLSKSWLHPQVMGICRVPERERLNLSTIFQSNFTATVRLANGGWVTTSPS